jgi:NADH-quinone oxidoreductase subunit A
VTGVSDYSTVAVLILAVIGLTAVIMILTHAIGPRRHGPVKDTAYESGVEPIGDARRRFNVRFYLVAVLFLVFDVEIIFLYPWAVLFPRLRDPAHQEWAAALSQAGYGPGFFLATIAVFFALLAVGFVYEWRKGVFRWD